MSNIHPSVTQNRSQNFGNQLTFKSDNVFQTNRDTSKPVLSKTINFMVSRPAKDKLYVLTEIFNKGDTIRNLEIKGNVSNTSTENLYVLVLRVGKNIQNEMTLPFNNLRDFKISRINFTNTGCLALLVRNNSGDSGVASCTYEYTR